ncbi:MAG: type II toxin-antitoxin system RelE/ParE family toxin [Clostridia bacterium]|nr:type II toxin-antitoxin system RelE/ParE family toxin [Clostridia bacterium]MDH7573856.1 type II toxin-antitoxin system RelE/ParE family toxin [Clostridia bacterium]
MYEVRPKNANRLRHDIARLTPDERERVREALLALAENPRPRGALCLEKNYYRIRVGPMRILYQVLDEERLILVGAIVRRSEATYRRWRSLFK